jgi:membrane protease YdiL (CAAX protease family)
VRVLHSAAAFKKLVLAKHTLHASNPMFSQISQQIAAYAFISFFEEVAFRSYLPLTLAYGFSTGTTDCIFPTSPPPISCAKNKIVLFR